MQPHERVWVVFKVLPPAPAGLAVNEPATSAGLRVISTLPGDERVEVFVAEVPGFDGPRVLKVLKPTQGLDGAAFVARTRALQALTHRALRPILATGQMKDGRAYVITTVTDAPTLATHTALSIDDLVRVGVELLGGLEVVHAAGLALGRIDARDIHVAQVMFDVTLAGLGPQSTPEGDVRALAEVLIAAGVAALDHGPFESTIRRTLQGAATATALRLALAQLRERWLSGTVTSRSNPEVLSVTHDLSGVTLGQYRLERVLGEGAMGTVYLARHQRIGRMAAIKVLKAEHAQDTELLQRFIQEAQAVNAIRNEHIVEVYDFGEQQLEDGSTRAFCVMELLDGQPLDQAMHSGPFSVRRATRLAQNMALALHAAHEVGVVHRDIKPENIYLQRRAGDDEFVKVLDFGVAKLMAPIGNLPRSGTQAGMVIGTPEYMAPEQALGSPTDRRVDLYAVGLVLYELLSGEQPFHGDTFGKLVVEITSKPPPPLPTVTRPGDAISPGLVNVVMRCLAKDPEARFQTGEALAHALAPFVDGVVVAEAPPPSKRPKVALVLAGATALVALLALVVMQSQVAAPPPPPPPPSPAEVVEVKPVWLEVVTVPEGATVTRVDTAQILGTTPLKRALVPTDSLALRFEHEGFQGLERSVSLSSNVALSVALVATPKQDAPKAAPAKKRAPEKKQVNEDAVLDPFAE